MEAEQQISPFSYWQIPEEEEEISGQMGGIIPPGCRPTVSTLPVSSVMPSVALNGGIQLAGILIRWPHLLNCLSEGGRESLWGGLESFS